MVKLEFERTYDIDDNLINETVYIRVPIQGNKDKAWCGLGITVEELKELKENLKNFTLKNLSQSIKQQDEFGKIIIYK